MEHQTCITDTNKGLERAHESQPKKKKENGFNFGLNLKGFLYYLLSYKSYNMDVILKYAFIFFRPLLWSPVGLSSCCVWTIFVALKQKSELVEVHYCTIRSVFLLDWLTDWLHSLFPKTDLGQCHVFAILYITFLWFQASCQNLGQLVAFISN